MCSEHLSTIHHNISSDFTQIQKHEFLSWFRMKVYIYIFSLTVSIYTCIFYNNTNIDVKIYRYMILKKTNLLEATIELCSLAQ